MMLEIKKKTNRQSGFELLRILAMLLIVTQHLAEHTTFPEHSLANKLLLSFMLLGGGIGVNVFVMISGYFYTSRFKTQKATTLILETLFYSVVMTLIALLCGAAEFRLKIIPRALFPFIFRGGEYWFITIYMLLYIVTPLIQPALQTIGRRYIGMVIVVFMLIYSVFPYTIGKYIMLQDLGFSKLCWFFLMYLCGAFIRKTEEVHPSCKCVNLFGLLICVLAMLAAKAVLTMEMVDAGIARTLFEALAVKLRNGPLQAFIAFFMVRLFCRIDFKAPSFFYTISSGTFGVYLIHNHALFTDFLWRNIIHTSDFVETFYFPLFVLAAIVLVFCVCSIIEYLRKQLLEKPVMTSNAWTRMCESFDSWLMKA